MDTTRREFFKRGKTEIRPPWALKSELFFAACTRCHDCIPACPNHIISTDKFNYPLLDFGKGECTFCGKCLTACTPQALLSAEKPWDYIAVIKESCLALHGTLCRLCGDECESRAISFPPQLAGFGPPVISASTCTGCGACLRQCPTQAISLKR